MTVAASIYPWIAHTHISNWKRYFAVFEFSLRVLLWSSDERKFFPLFAALSKHSIMPYSQEDDALNDFDQFFGTDNNNLAVGDDENEEIKDKDGEFFDRWLNTRTTIQWSLWTLFPSSQWVPLLCLTEAVKLWLSLTRNCLKYAVKAEDSIESSPEWDEEHSRPWDTRMSTLPVNVGGYAILGSLGHGFDRFSSDYSSMRFYFAVTALIAFCLLICSSKRFRADSGTDSEIVLWHRSSWTRP